MLGVYGIHNNTKDRWYVGKSKDVSKRLSSHLSALKRGTHHCPEMQADYDSGDEFTFAPIVTEPKISAEQLSETENRYIEMLSTYYKNKGYNKNTNLAEEKILEKKAKPFYRWMMTFIDEDSPRGDLAQDMKGDRDFPRKAVDYDSIYVHLFLKGACYECKRTLQECYNEYSLQYFGHPLELDEDDEEDDE